MSNKIVGFCLVIFACWSCKENRNNNQQHNQQSHTFFKIANSITVEENQNNWLVKDGSNTILFAKEELPLQKVVCIPTAALAYLNALDLQEHVQGVAQPKYIYNPNIKEGLRKGKIALVGNEQEIFVEQILLLQPDLVISFNNPTWAKFHKQLQENGIRVLLLNEYLESEPLGKTELLKLFGLLFGKLDKANNLFLEIQKSYKALQQKVKDKEQPKVIAGVMYGDIWFAPGAKSFPAKLIADAGGNYVWQNNNTNAAVKKGFEEVYSQQQDADFWINAADFLTLSALEASYQKYNWLQAFKNKNVYNYIAQSNTSGANNFHEQGIVRADWVLQDLAKIFHPDLFKNDSLIFYQRLP